MRSARRIAADEDGADAAARQGIVVSPASLCLLWPNGPVVTELVPRARDWIHKIETLFFFFFFFFVVPPPLHPPPLPATKVSKPCRSHCPGCVARCAVSRSSSAACCLARRACTLGRPTLSTSITRYGARPRLEVPAHARTVSHRHGCCRRRGGCGCLCLGRDGCRFLRPQQGMRTGHARCSTDRVYSFTGTHRGDKVGVGIHEDLGIDNGDGLQRTQGSSERRPARGRGGGWVEPPWVDPCRLSRRAPWRGGRQGHQRGIQRWCACGRGGCTSGR